MAATRVMRIESTTTRRRERIAVMRSQAVVRYGGARFVLLSSNTVDEAANAEQGARDPRGPFSVGRV
jgi:hypothetical protein